MRRTLTSLVGTLAVTLTILLFILPDVVLSYLAAELALPAHDLLFAFSLVHGVGLFVVVAMWVAYLCLSASWRQRREK